MRTLVSEETKNITHSLLLKAHPYLRYEQICIDPTSGNDGIFL